MARHKRTYVGERRTIMLGMQLTPSEREELEKAAERQGASISAYARELLFRRSAAVVAKTRRNPEAAGLMRALTLAGHELNAAGNNLNQIARHLNTTVKGGPNSGHSAATECGLRAPIVPKAKRF